MVKKNQPLSPNLKVGIHRRGTSGLLTRLVGGLRSKRGVRSPVGMAGSGRGNIAAAILLLYPRENRVEVWDRMDLPLRVGGGGSKLYFNVNKT